MTDILIEEETVVETQEEDPEYVHIIDRGDDPRSAFILVLEARVKGTPLTALCGYMWVPERNVDPNDFVCPKCIEMYEFAKDFRGV